VPAAIVATATQATRSQRTHRIDKLGKDRDDYFAELIAAAWIAEQRYAATREGAQAPKPYVDKSIWNQRRMQLRALRRRRAIIEPLEAAGEPTVDPWPAWQARADLGILERSIPARLLSLLARDEVLDSGKVERRDREALRAAREWARLVIPDSNRKTARSKNVRAR
jgi:DNA-directed RNA polymerase specialized sigma24 family protein